MVQQLIIKPTRGSSFLDSSLRLDGITDILNIVSEEPRYFTQVMNESRIKFKKSFLKYLKYCVEQGFMTKSQVSKSGAHERYHVLMSKGRFFTFYQITDKGRTFLEMVK